MPGVPTGKACDACRRSRKKCDIKQPVCSRCDRLKLECIGGGIQRYKFKQIAIADASKKEGSSLHHRRQDKHHKNRDSSRLTRRSWESTLTSSFLYSPSNDQTKLINAFIPIIDQSTDLRYNIGWAFGVFFEDIPQRLGCNKALDCAVDFVTSAHAGFCSRRRASVETLSKYSRALRALRVCLDDPDTVHSSNTLCAINLLWICQIFIAPTMGGYPWPSHGEGAASILAGRGDVRPRNEFEQKLLSCLSASVLVEAVFNDRIQLNPQQWETLVISNFGSEIPECHTLLLLSRAPDLMRRGRQALNSQHGVTDLRNETWSLYEACKVNNNILKNRLTDNECVSPSSSSTVNTLHPNLITNHYQRTYAFGLVVSIVFNCILVALDQGSTTTDIANTNLNLELEPTSFAYEILGIVMRTSSICRPMGTGFLIFCLAAAWVGTTDSQLRVLIENLLVDYQRDFEAWPMKQSEMLEWTAMRVRLGVSFTPRSGGIGGF